MEAGPFLAALLAVHLGACTPAAFSMSDAAPPLVVRSGPIRQRVRGDALDLAALPAVGLEHGRDGGERYIAVQSEASLDPGTGPRRTADSRHSSSSQSRTRSKCRSAIVGSHSMHGSSVIPRDCPRFLGWARPRLGRRLPA